VRVQELTPAPAQSFGLPTAEGGLVADLTADGPAARAGLARGDVVLSVNGRKIIKKHDLLLAVAALPRGQKVSVSVWRQGAEVVLWPIIGEMPTNYSPIVPTAPRENQAQSQKFIVGLRLGPLTKARRELLEVPSDVRGVIVLSIDANSTFLRLGMRSGDVIESINQQPVSSPAEATARLNQAIASGRKSVLMLINRNSTNRYLAMSLDQNEQDES
jgi:serine protease Do